MSILTEAQAHDYEMQSYLLVSGLIPHDVAANAEAAMWHLLEATPDDPASWQRATAAHQVFDSPELLACYNPALLAAAAQLAGDPVESVHAPARAYAINVFPTSAEWSWPHPHIDHAIKEHGHHTCPRAFRVASMTFLSDVGPHGGGTVVWPGSHAVLERIAKSDPVRYETMWALNQELAHLDLGEPIELTPKRGDVLFYSYLCAHAGSRNVSAAPRLALNAKW
jgi:ectoine hydroxylase-related dioxygenase (phytanoyl-CoA dioxygenase family)